MEKLGKTDAKFLFLMRDLQKVMRDFWSISDSKSAILLEPTHSSTV